MVAFIIFLYVLVALVVGAVGLYIAGKADDEDIAGIACLVAIFWPAGIPLTILAWLGIKAFEAGNARR